MKILITALLIAGLMLNACAYAKGGNGHYKHGKKYGAY
jgi:hypothetical protein